MPEVYIRHDYQAALLAMRSLLTRTGKIILFNMPHFHQMAGFTRSPIPASQNPLWVATDEIPNLPPEYHNHLQEARLPNKKEPFIQFTVSALLLFSLFPRTN